MRGWPLAIVLFFACVIAADSFLIYKALSVPDPIAEDYIHGDRDQLSTTGLEADAEAVEAAEQ